MSPATITRITTELLEQGIVYEGTQAKSTGGRKPVYLHLDYTKLYIVSVQLIRDRTEAAVLNLKGDLLLKRDIKPEAFTPHGLLSEVYLEIEDILTRSAINRDHILGVGVAISGVVDSTRGLMVKSVNLDWENVPVADMLGGMLSLPVYVANDANAAALAELWFGQCRDCDSFLYLKTDTGAGVGLVIQRQLVSGHRWLAGEIGHLPVIPDGRRCRCGQQGCLEAYVYLSDVLDRYRAASGRAVTKEEFLYMAQSGDGRACALVAETAQAIAQAVSSWGVLLDLDRVVIGGMWGQMEEQVIRPVYEHYRRVLTTSGLERDICISGSSLSDDNDLFGAAGIVIHSWLSPELAAIRGGEAQRDQ